MPPIKKIKSLKTPKKSRLQKNMEKRNKVVPVKLTPQQAEEVRLEQEKSKLRSKLDIFMRYVKTELNDHGTEKRTTMKKSFQVVGKLYSLELGFTHKLEMAGSEFFIRREPFLKTFNSRSTQGGYSFHNMEDIANALGLKVIEIEKYYKKLESHSKFTPKEIGKAKSYFIKRVQRSADRITNIAEEV